MLFMVSILYNSVPQTVVQGPPVVRGGFGRKGIAKIVSDTERMKNTLIHVCAKTAFVGCPSRGSMRISPFHKLSYFNHYF
jgi:hypothetical protein